MVSCFLNRPFVLVFQHLSRLTVLFHYRSRMQALRKFSQELQKTKDKGKKNKNQKKCKPRTASNTEESTASSTDTDLEDNPTSAPEEEAEEPSGKEEDDELQVAASLATKGEQSNHPLGWAGMPEPYTHPNWSFPPPQSPPPPPRYGYHPSNSYAYASGSMQPGQLVYDLGGTPAPSGSPGTASGLPASPYPVATPIQKDGIERRRRPGSQEHPPPPSQAPGHPPLPSSASSPPSGLPLYYPPPYYLGPPPPPYLYGYFPPPPPPASCWAPTAYPYTNQPPPPPPQFASLPQYGNPPFAAATAAYPPPRFSRRPLDQDLEAGEEQVLDYHDPAEYHHYS
jgi:hypothetical protein